MEPLSPVTYTDVQMALNLLKQVSSLDIEIQPLVFTKPYYSRTASGPQHSSGESDTVVMRKNIYYLARKSKNTGDLLEHLVQSGVLTVDDQEAINQQPRSLLKSVLMFSKILTKEPKTYEKFLSVLQTTGNGEIVTLLTLHLLRSSPNATVGQEEKPRVKVVHGLHPGTNVVHPGTNVVHPGINVGINFVHPNLGRGTFDPWTVFTIAAAMNLCVMCAFYDYFNRTSWCFCCLYSTLMDSPQIKLCLACMCYLRNTMATMGRRRHGASLIFNCNKNNDPYSHTHRCKIWT